MSSSCSLCSKPISWIGVLLIVLIVLLLAVLIVGISFALTSQPTTSSSSLATDTSNENVNENLSSTTIVPEADLYKQKPYVTGMIVNRNIQRPFDPINTPKWLGEPALSKLQTQINNNTMQWLSNHNEQTSIYLPYTTT